MSYNVRRSTFGAQRSAFGVRRSVGAVGIWRRSEMVFAAAQCEKAKLERARTEGTEGTEGTEDGGW
jgi:hypothetical protein